MRRPPFWSTVLSLSSLGLAAALIVGAIACSSSSPDAQPATRSADAGSKSEASASAVATRDPALANVDVAKLEAEGGVAYFAGGCFWGVEHFLEQIDGVVRVESGFMGGDVDEPSYEDVLSHESGHLETVRVYFDPAKVSFEVIAKRFFEIHDPTQANGQGPDIGPQYLSAVFVTGAAQREVSEALIARLRERGYDVATKVEPAASFWLAEDYHQDYYAKHDKVPYCHAPVDRFGDGGGRQ